jgi:uncharacterized membrane protein
VVRVPHQEASAVVAAPLVVVETELRDVERWSQFLIGVEEVTKTGHDRYVFTVKDGSRLRNVPVAVVCHLREHRISWRALEGARFEGELRLAVADDGHTRVGLVMTAEPSGFLAGLADMLGSSKSTAALDLQRLDTYLTARRSG